MPFILDQTPTYTWPVKIELPGNGGKTDVSTFEAVFLRVKQEKLKELLNTQHEDAKAFARQVLVGWGDGEVSVDGKAPLAYSEANRETLLDVQLVAMAVVRAFIESVTLGKAKN